MTTISRLVDLARKFEARALEINPLVVTEDLQLTPIDSSKNFEVV